VGELWLTPPISLTTDKMIKLKHFKKTMTELLSVEKFLLDLEQLGINEGIDPKHVTVVNTLQKATSRLNFLKGEELKAQEIGYTSLSLALKALKQIKGLEISGLDLLPEDFHKVPNIWFDGKPDGKDPVRNPGFKPMSVSVAKRKLRVVQPLVVEAWQLADGDEDIQSTILTTYLTTSADEFEKTLYRYIYDLEEVSLEEELTNVVQPTDTEVEKTLKYMLDPNRIYGVVKKKIDEEG